MDKETKPTPPPSILIMPLRRALMKMLKHHPPAVRATLLDQWEGLAVDARSKLDRLSTRTSVEIWDRGLGDLAYSIFRARRVLRASESDNETFWKEVEQADARLRELCVDAANAWLSTTGGPVPILEDSVLKAAGAGYRPGRDALIARNPFWLYLAAAGFLISAKTVRDLISSRAERLGSHN